MSDTIQRYLEDAIASEKAVRSQLSSFGNDGDDVEVQQTFAAGARACAAYEAALSHKLENLGGSPSTLKSVLSQVLSGSPRTLQVTHTQEERLVQNLISGYTLLMGQSGMYQALATASALANQADLSQSANSLVNEKADLAQKLWSFIPSRAKIAFNVLTAGEVDPSVETRTQDLRLL